MNRWTADEVNILKDQYGKVPVEDIDLPNRNAISIRHKASRLGLRSTLCHMPNVLPNNRKRCSKCNEVKDKSQFPKNKNAWDGVYNWCSDCNNRSSRQYLNRNRDIVYSKSNARRSANLLRWCEFFDSEYGKPKCHICEIDLEWTMRRGTNRKGVVNWDHRRGDHASEVCSPANWIRNHLCNELNQSKWKYFDFGILCNTCNGSLPTQQRIEWLESALNYARSADASTT